MVFLVADSPPLCGSQAGRKGGTSLGSQTTRCGADRGRLTVTPSKSLEFITQTSTYILLSEFTESQKLSRLEDNFTWGHILHAELLDLQFLKWKVISQHNFLEKNFCLIGEIQPFQMQDHLLYKMLLGYQDSPNHPLALQQEKGLCVSFITVEPKEPYTEKTHSYQ